MSKKKAKNTTNDTTKLPKNVFLRGGKWYVVVSVPTLKRYEDGRKIYKRIVRRCRIETEDFANELIADILAAFAQKQDDAAYPTLLSLLEKYLATKARSLEERTKLYYRDLIDRFIDGYEIASQRAYTLKPINIQNHYDRLLRIHSADAVIRLNGFLFAAFAQGIYWQVMETNPCEGILLPKHVRAESAFFSRQEARDIIRLAQHRPEHFIFQFLLETTMRPQEALAIRWSDIDFNKKIAHIRQAVAEGPTGPYIKQPKTKGSKRTIPIGDNLINALKEHKKRQEAFMDALLEKANRDPLLSHMKRQGLNYKKRIKVSANAKEYHKNFLEFRLVFPTVHGAPWSIKHLNTRLFKPFIKKAGFDPKQYSVRCLRHTSATILAEKLPPKVLQDRMGHADIKTTMNIYAHVLDESKERSAQIIEEELY